MKTSKKRNKLSLSAKLAIFELLLLIAIAAFLLGGYILIET